MLANVFYPRSVLLVSSMAWPSVRTGCKPCSLDFVSIFGRCFFYRSLNTRSIMFWIFVFCLGCFRVASLNVFKYTSTPACRATTVYWRLLLLPAAKQNILADQKEIRRKTVLSIVAVVLTLCAVGCKMIARHLRVSVTWHCGPAAFCCNVFSSPPLHDATMPHRT